MHQPVFFRAGIIQGALPDAMHDQGYRGSIGAILQHAFPEATIFNPVEAYPGSLNFDYQTGKHAFFDLMARAGRADVLVAYLPEASMGTAIEIWNAYNAGHLVIAISPLAENWVLKFMAHHICPDVADFDRFVESGALADLMARHAAGGTARP